MQKAIYSILFLLFNSFFCEAQNQYELSIAKHREQYKKEFLVDENSPLKKEDLKFLQFYKPNTSYIVKTNFIKINDTIGFTMMTHNGTNKKYFVYGSVSFSLKGTQHILYIYQSEKLKIVKGFEDYLFIPFTDETNNVSTFGGGRYLDFKEKDIFNNTLLIDFNKCYNPYCAYKDGYACPIPPKENELKIAIEAGEKLYGK